MAIIVENDVGWLVCHKKYLNDIYELCRNLTIVPCALVPKCDIFDINSPFVMDSAIKSISTDDESSNSLRKKKRKWSRACNNDLDDYYDKIKEYIQNAMDSLIGAGKLSGHFSSNSLTSIERMKNNSSAREMAKSIQFDNSLCQHCEENLPVLYVAQTQKDFQMDNINLIRMKVYDEPCSVILSFLGEKYVIPNNAQFLLADVRHLKVLTMIPDSKFDVILLDPPWCNKSVKRKRGYWTLQNDELLNLPVNELANSQCLVIVWTTNNGKQMSFVKTELFPRWSIQYCAEWHWLKVTKRGVPIHSLESSHKKPYENLILGERKITGTNLSKIPNHRVIVSVPSSIHSHKPPLTEILKPYIPANSKCLEIFGRYLLPNWTSCGNEVLKLQHTKLFDILEDKSS